MTFAVGGHPPHFNARQQPGEWNWTNPDGDSLATMQTVGYANDAAAPWNLGGRYIALGDTIHVYIAGVLQPIQKFSDVTPGSIAWVDA